MKLERIDNCTTYFNYGLIDASVVANSFTWEEDEDIDLLPVLEFIEQNNVKKYIYLITSRTCQYPLGTMDKKLKLWDKITKEHDLKLVRKNERQERMSRFYLYYGMAEILKDKLRVALEILKKDFIHSCLLLSDEKIDLDQKLNKIMSISQEKKDYYLDFARLINSECVKSDVITSIIGSNGRTINYFYLLK